MDNVINFVSNNYIWFIVAGAILLVVALVLLLVKKSSKFSYIVYLHSFT